MKNNPQITVLMPAYNAEKYIGEAIESILNQSLIDFELLIINDASTDNTLNIINKYKDPRIRVVINQKNLGLTRTLNKGIDLARGEYIARLDSDDVALPQRLEKQASCFTNDKKLAMVASWCEVIDKEGNNITYGKWKFTPEAIYYILNFRNCLTHSSVMFKKQIVSSLGGYSEGIYTEDFDLWQKVSRVGKIEQLNEVLVKWRSLEDSLSNVNPKHTVKEAAMVTKHNLEKLLDNRISDEVVNFFINNRNIIYLNNKEANTAMNDFIKIIDKIVDKMPAFYDKNKLISYIDIEIAKMRFIFKKKNITYSLNKKMFFSSKLLGYVAYLVGFKKQFYLYYIFPKSHF